MNIAAYTLFTQVNIYVFIMPPLRMIAIIALIIPPLSATIVSILSDCAFWQYTSELSG
jgi:hypothetical protein